MDTRSLKFSTALFLAAAFTGSPALAQSARDSCPAAFTDFRERIHICRCTAVATASGLVFGNDVYARDAAVCRSALHAAAIGPEGGDVIVHVLPLDGELSGADRNRVQSQAARFDGRAFRPMSATPGNLDWARRAVVAYGTPNRPFPALGQREGLVPLPALQAAGLDNATLRAELEKQPNFAHVSPPVIMPAFWRTPVRAPDAPLLQPGTALSRGISIPTAPAPAPPASAATPAALPPAAAVAVRGAPQVLSTARLIVAGQSVSLAHIEGIEGPQALGLAAFIASSGGTVSCEPVPPAAGMRCLTQDGVDLAEAALFNGGARATSDATPAFRAAELAARQARRGLWAEGVR